MADRSDEPSEERPPEAHAAGAHHTMALTPAARRALDEADARRRRVAAPAATEIGGRGGLDPVRFGDWEVKGLTSDF